MPNKHLLRYAFLQKHSLQKRLSDVVAECLRWQRSEMSFGFPRCFFLMTSCSWTLVLWLMQLRSLLESVFHFSSRLGARVRAEASQVPLVLLVIHLRHVVHPSCSVDPCNTGVSYRDHESILWYMKAPIFSSGILVKPLPLSASSFGWTISLLKSLWKWEALWI